MGELHFKDKRIDDQVYCKLCLEREKALGQDGRYTRVYSLSSKSSSGNFLNHAATEHDKLKANDSNQRKMDSWLAHSSSDTPASSKFELNRDLILWLCMDILPFETISKPGFQKFNEKNLKLDLPSDRCLATTALVDVYMALKVKITSKLAETSGVCLMMDGWTDQHKRFPYFAIRAATIDPTDWTYKVFTLVVKPVLEHTAESLNAFVREILLEFFKDVPPQFFNTTDGAANMVKLSKLLGHQRQTCVAHCLHNLLQTDGLENVQEVQVLLSQCKKIIDALKWKAHQMSDEKMTEQETAFFDSIQSAHEEMDVDEMYPFGEGTSGSGPDKSMQEPQGFSSLKNSVPTRWNSTLVMVSSIVKNHAIVNQTLKKSGRFDLCLMPDDVAELKALQTFLEPFESLTKTVSKGTPNLSMIPLMKSRLKKLCTVDQADSSVVKSLKNCCMKELDHRLPITDLVKTSAAFDPLVRDIVLSRTECSELIEQVYSKFQGFRYAAVVSLIYELRTYFFFQFF